MCLRKELCHLRSVVAVEFPLLVAVPAVRVVSKMLIRVRTYFVTGDTMYCSGLPYSLSGKSGYTDVGGLPDYPGIGFPLSFDRLCLIAPDDLRLKACDSGRYHIT